MRLSQKVFWIFFSVTIITLLLALNQFVTYHIQQSFSRTIDQIGQLQDQVRQLDQLHLELFQRGKWFDRVRFERLRKESLASSSKLRTQLAQMPLPLLEKLDSMAFNLNNFGQALHELADARSELMRLEAAIHGVLRNLHSHKSMSPEHRVAHLTGGSAHTHEMNADSVADLQLQFQVSSFVHHRQFQRLPAIKNSVARLKQINDDVVLANELDYLVQQLEKYYQCDLLVTDRKQFVESAAGSFLDITTQMLSDLKKINIQRQQMISQASLAISFIAVLAAVFYWFRIRIYLRRFLYNQNQVMQAIKTDSSSELQLVPQSKDELGDLTGTLKNLSVELKNKKADLLASEQKYRSLVESLNEWIWETNVNHRFSYCSQAGEKITGFPQAKMLGRKYLVLSKECEDEAVFSHIEQHFRERTPFTNIERKIVCADGQLKHLIASGIPQFDSDEKFIGFRGVDRDVTALVAAREAHEQLEMKLQHSQKMESIGRLAGGVAHDFNNILSAIIGYTEVILHRLDRGDKCYRYVTEIRNSGERAASLTKQLLAFSRKQARTPEILDLAKEARALEDMLGRLVGEQIDLQIEIEGAIWPVMMDKSQLEQVIVNLAVNAKDAMPQGGALRIRLKNCLAGCRCRQNTRLDLPDGDYVLLTVSDTGYGMSEEVQRNIFDPFFTTKEKDKGTGLGLSMVYGIITQNSGDIWVESEVGKGSSFNILLPRSARVSSGQQKEELKKNLRRGRETILFAEDERALRQMHAEFLESLGYRVVTAEDGVEALEKYAREDRVDMLITDVVMPNMGGIELAEKVLEQTPDLKILYTSGYTDHSLFEKGILKEGENFISKPATPFDVVKMMEKLLD